MLQSNSLECFRGPGDAESSVKDAVTLNFNDCLVTIGSQLQKKTWQNGRI